MNPKYVCILFFYLLLASTAAHSNDSRLTQIEPPQRVLFVGNSFSFYNNGLHTQLRKFLQQAPPDPSAAYAQKLATISGARLGEHQAGLPSLLKSFKPNVVILQGHSLESVDSKQSEGFRESARHLVEISRKAGVLPVLFMTWAYTGKPEMTTQLAEAYSSLGDELTVLVVPVGLAFRLAEIELPGVDLRIDDLKHPSPAGSYLAAAVIYSALYQATPEGLDYNAGLEPGLARQLRQIAWRSVVDYYSW